MMRRLSIRRALGAAAFALCAVLTGVAAQAATVTMIIDGTVNTVFSTAAVQPAQIGDRGTLFITYDASTPPDGGVTGTRFYPSAVSQVRFTGGLLDITTDQVSTFTIVNEDFADRDQVIFRTPSGANSNTIFLNVSSGSGTEFWTSDALPTTLPSPLTFFNPAFEVAQLADFDNGSVVLTITDMRIEPGIVPVPAGLPLLAGGLALAALATRRRRAQRA